jgi:hypothetical protein
MFSFDDKFGYTLFLFFFGPMFDKQNKNDNIYDYYCHDV